ncbi:MAG TPA: glycosyltransferase family 4 protein [Blastocatellia bacterium]|nr:glycosyltransferase family 4 protein [Blastocatellia bacterium]
MLSLRVQTETETQGRIGLKEDARAPLRVLYFAPRECWPTNTGAKLRNFHLVRELARAARVTYLGFADEATAPCRGLASERGLAGVCTEVTVERDSAYTIGKIARGALTSTPLPVLNYSTEAMRRELARLLDEQDFDVVQIESLSLASYLPVVRAARSRPAVVADWHNIDSEVMRRYSEHTTSLARRLYARVTARRLERLEAWAMRELDAHIAVSRRDEVRMLEHAPAARVITIENGVDVDYYSDEKIEQAYRDWVGRCPQTDRSGNREVGNKITGNRVIGNRIIFVGSMDYHANVDAAVRFAREVWPAVHAENPYLVFTIVGRNPAPDVRALAGLPGVEVTGTVSDVRPFYREAAASIVPLRIGGGSRLKILESLAAGVPVISTELGAEGIDATPGRDIVVADSKDELAGASVRLARDSAERQSLIKHGRALVRAEYDWSRKGAALLRFLESVTARRSVARTGAETYVSRRLIG